MKILMICNLPEEYNTSSVICSNLICKGWVENGHDVVLATPNPSPMHKYYCEDYDYSNLKVKRIRYGKPIYESKVNHTDKKSVKGALISLLKRIYKKYDLFGRTIEYINEYKTIASELNKISFKPDIIISTSNPKTSHLIANKLRIKLKDKNITFIQYWGDPLAIDISIKSSLPFWIKKNIEYRIISKADKIVYVSPITCKEQQKLYPELKEKIYFVATPCDNTVYGKVEGITLGYFGSYNSTVRDIMPLYFAMSMNEDCKLYIVGDSDVKLAPLKNVYIIGRISQSDLQQYYDKCNVLVDLTNYKGGQIPAKIFRDAGTNREVLLLCDERNEFDIKSFFKKFNRYTICGNYSEEINHILEKYRIEGIQEKRPLTSFHYRNIAEAIINTNTDNHKHEGSYGRE